METGVNYLNLEYLLVRLVDLFGAAQSSFGDLPSALITTITTLYLIGMVASLIFLILIVYAEIQLLHTEHAGFHALETHAHEEHEPEVESTGKNDRWERIVVLAASGNQSEWRRAILEADIMLGDALAEFGYTGAGVGEQLKMANPIQLTTLDLAWKAHKVRNDVAHGGESYALTERDARTAIDYYKRVFEELGAI
jgi:hypothetical protein